MERLRRTLCDECRSGGPNSWFADVMLTRTQDWFSLHLRGTVPYLPGHPYLDGNWQENIQSKTLTAGEKIIADRWTLRCEALDRQDLPFEWAEQATGTQHPRTVSGECKLSSWEAYIDADAVQRLSLSTPRPGQRFEPLGMGGRGKPLADYFTDRKVPRLLRSGWPILLDGERIIWVGGHQIADTVRIKPGSRRVLHLFWESTLR